MKSVELNTVHLTIVFCLFFFSSSEVFGSGISTCDAIKIPPRDSGARYEGMIRNDDYRFSAVVPPHLTGWGAASGAPFHGFTIYLSADAQSCIDFSIAIHVSLPEDEKRARHSIKSDSRSRIKKIKGNGWTGIETTTRGQRQGTSFDNIDITFSILRTTPVAGAAPISNMIDVGITLVTPTLDRNRTEAVFREFLAQLTFW